MEKGQRTMQVLRWEELRKEEIYLGCMMKIFRYAREVPSQEPRDNFEMLPLM